MGPLFALSDLSLYHSFATFPRSCRTAASDHRSSVQSLLSFPLIYALVIACAVAPVEGQQLTKHRIPNAECADGSEAIIYSDFYSDFYQKKKQVDCHIIFFNGGGFCGEDEECRSILENQPTKLGSAMYPEIIQGESILSSDPRLNRLFDCSKHYVPYCTQDMFLGSNRTEDSNGLRRTGSIILTKVFDFWSNISSPGQNLTVVGNSAGAIGLINHYNDIINVARNASVTTLRVILDSAPIRLENSFNYTETFSLPNVDPVKHPLCFEEANDNDFLMPCCSSITCVIEREPLIHSWAAGLVNEEQNSTNVSHNEALLLINSLYDPIEIGLSVDAGNGFSLSLFLEPLWDLGRFVGEKKNSISTSVSIANREIQKRSSSAPSTGGQIVILESACVSHGFLFPAIDFGYLQCLGSDDLRRICDTDRRRIGFLFELKEGFNMIFWQGAENWDVAEVDETSIHAWIDDFTLSNRNSTIIRSPSRTEGFSVVVIGDDCDGPNCIGEGQMGPPPCQQFIELTDDFGNIGVAWEYTLMSLLLVSSFVAYALRFSYSSSSFVEGHRKTGRRKTYQVTKLKVWHKKSGKKILKDININLTTGEITALAGKSGSGKSTLLKALAKQLSPSLVFQVNERGFDEMHSIKVCYFRQDDHSEFVNMTPSVLLDLNAKLYGATKTQLHSLMPYVETFKDTCIRNLSGGQRRRVALLSLLLLNPRVVLLDEPLSGLDSVSAKEVLDLLNEVVKTQNVHILMSIHQPSSEIMKCFHNLIIMHQGKILLNCDNQDLWRVGNRNASDMLHSILGEDRKSIEDASLRMSGQKSPKLELPLTPTRARREALMFRQPMIAFTQQLNLIIRRMHHEGGPGLRDILIPIGFFIFCSLVASIDKESPTVIMSMVVAFIASPNVMYQYKVKQVSDFWVLHKMEMKDGRISPWAYLLATELHIFATPVIGTFFATMFTYLILDWRFESFVLQFLFSAFYLVFTVQLGKTISVIFDGDYEKFLSVYTLWLLSWFVFGGFFVPIQKFPFEARWLVLISPTFWGVSGSFLHQIEDYRVSVASGPCTSMTSCLITEPALIARLSGYRPYSTIGTSLAIIISLFLGMIAAEAVLIHVILAGGATQKNSREKARFAWSPRVSSPSVNGMQFSLDKGVYGMKADKKASPSKPQSVMTMFGRLRGASVATPARTCGTDRIIQQVQTPPLGSPTSTSFESNHASSAIHGRLRGATIGPIGTPPRLSGNGRHGLHVPATPLRSPMSTSFESRQASSEQPHSQIEMKSFFQQRVSSPLEKKSHFTLGKSLRMEKSPRSSGSQPTRDVFDRKLHLGVKRSHKRDPEKSPSASIIGSRRVSSGNASKSTSLSPTKRVNMARERNIAHSAFRGSASKSSSLSPTKRVSMARERNIAQSALRGSPKNWTRSKDAIDGSNRPASPDEEYNRRSRGREVKLVIDSRALRQISSHFQDDNKDADVDPPEQGTNDNSPRSQSRTSNETTPKSAKGAAGGRRPQKGTFSRKKVKRGPTEESAGIESPMRLARRKSRVNQPRGNRKDSKRNTPTRHRHNRSQSASKSTF